MVQSRLIILGTVLTIGLGTLGAIAIRVRTNPPNVHTLHPAANSDATVHIVALDNGYFSFKFEHAPPYVHALAQAPSELEERLKRDTWLVMTCAMWSAPDLTAIYTAIETAREFGGNIQLGVRAFVDYDELSTWYPVIPENEYGSPQWLLLRAGEPVWQSWGVRSQGYLVDSIRDVLGESTTNGVGGEVE